MTAESNLAPVPTDTSRAQILIQGLGKVYRTRRGHHRALDSVDVSIRAGEFVSLLGPSGCGKTTLLNALATRLPPAERLVTVEDVAELRLPELRAAAYDGDTPSESRDWVRRHATYVLTNPDMLHVGVLPNHRSWGDVLANLAFVVVDEAHVYRGVFGSHVANVLRRLRRLARAYGKRIALYPGAGADVDAAALAAQIGALADDDRAFAEMGGLLVLDHQAARTLVHDDDVSDDLTTAFARVCDAGPAVDPIDEQVGVFLYTRPRRALLADQIAVRTADLDRVVVYGPAHYPLRELLRRGACPAFATHDQRLIREAIELHIESLRENGEVVPRPHSFVEKVAV